MKIDYLRGLHELKADPKMTEKLLVGSLLVLSTMIIPIVGQLALLGWQALIMRRVATHQQGLPRLDFDTDYLGKLVGFGFKGFLARMLWTIPLILLFVLFGCGYAGLVAAASSSRDLAEFLPFCMCGAQLIFMPIVFLAMLPAAVAGMRAELADDLKEGTNFKEVLNFTKVMLRPLLIGTIVISVVGAMLTFVGMLACGLGIFPAVVAMSVAQAHMMGQIYLAAVAQAVPEVQIAPDISQNSATVPQSF